jgi:hypothetical protein
MSEACPLLSGLPLEADADKDGFIWDTAIPKSCRDCLRAALEKHNLTTHYFEPLLYEGENLADLELYVSHGLHRGEGKSMIAVEEIGIDRDGSEGSLLSKTVARTTCVHL